VDRQPVTCDPGTPKKVKAETYQFPSGTTSPKYINWSQFDASSSLTTSNFLATEIQPKLLSTHAKNIAHLDALLNWYRYFKELRNAIAHHGGHVSQRVVDAFDAAQATSLVAAGMGRNLASGKPVLATKVQLPLGDAVLFLGLIQRLAFAFDAKYCSTAVAEVDLKDRVTREVGKHAPPREAVQQKIDSWLTNFFRHKLNIVPGSLPNAASWLKTNGLVNIKKI